MKNEAFPEEVGKAGLGKVRGDMAMYLAAMGDTRGNAARLKDLVPTANPGCSSGVLASGSSPERSAQS